MSNVHLIQECPFIFVEYQRVSIVILLGLIVLWRYSLAYLWVKCSSQPLQTKPVPFYKPLSRQDTYFSAHALSFLVFHTRKIHLALPRPSRQC
ncbi:hypothetical protein P153DRAFT_154203 [Dothidotthia symphoricarpi CBS 119687]|uniref:Uncharacterized protein n=1 Tax=Dothidotthia symphoricarpi CBS 119687 TaxID=1392245 RepID=A0A6A6AQM1_9PLEO|nr:uncharacterized protein P153DRAFT_154203 [Dothidotthia symphoricarpi CBS 119687]KAF2133315.1 hypothetical protein P153DRAFT_154203 [Dothidotthia symphoricarpi CBS 119687]